MTDLDDIPFGESTPRLRLAKPRKCVRHEWVAGISVEDVQTIYECFRCGKVKDDAASKRGRTSLRAGKDAERAIAKAYGGKRVGQYGGISDVEVGEMFSIQSKAGGWFSNRYWDELVKLPRTGGRIPTLIVSDRPGPGKPTRRMVVRMMSDDIDLHGNQEEQP